MSGDLYYLAANQQLADLRRVAEHERRAQCWKGNSFVGRVFAGLPRATARSNRDGAPAPAAIRRAVVHAPSTPSAHPSVEAWPASRP